MAVFFGHCLNSRFATSLSSLSSSFRSRPHSKPARISCSSSPSPSSPQMDPQIEGNRNRFMDFPYVSGLYRDLMVELVLTMESRLEPYLLPCTLPQDVQYYHNDARTAHGSLHIRSGIKPSPIDFVLGSWLHCELPSGALNITSLSAYLSPLTDAPNFLMELIQSSPTSLVFILDLPPRKDLVIHSDYLKTFYEDTQLERHRQLLEKIPEVRPYSSSSLYIRCVISPTAILVCIETEAGKTDRMEEIVRDYVSAVAKEVLGVWLDRCACGEREMGEADRIYLAKRDGIIKKETLQIDLGSSLPRLFGQEVAGRVLEAIQEVSHTRGI
ncbi:Red chlorophyll catabolite reductase [Actinidia chinensis var. chinensis]|uniref:Red chlorophyll catabolite reductase n=1 Tax=Actinidia chinensis var. chinensis TaxID=1590841 RepID=A0A2R6R5K7_ACTCC|nr:Red chlorophyll catabolite reductase [Actinidia chinensis var. chinensis]